MLGRAYDVAASDADDPAGWLVVCLCAAWCGVCRGYAETFAAAAAEHPGVRFAWVDVEDEAELVGDLDIETFPSVLIAHAGRPRYLAPIAPAAAPLTRLLASLRADPLGPALADLHARHVAAALHARTQASLPLAN